MAANKRCQSFGDAGEKLLMPLSHRYTAPSTAKDVLFVFSQTVVVWLLLGGLTGSTHNVNIPAAAIPTTSQSRPGMRSNRTPSPVLRNSARKSVERAYAI